MKANPLSGEQVRDIVFKAAREVCIIATKQWDIGVFTYPHTREKLAYLVSWLWRYAHAEGARIFIESGPSYDGAAWHSGGFFTVVRVEMGDIRVYETNTDPDATLAKACASFLTRLAKAEPHRFIETQQEPA